MKINIYNNSSLIELERPNNFNEKHTISSLNKIKNKPKVKQVLSSSDFASTSCLQLLTSTSSNRRIRNTQSNIDMYKLGQQFLQHKEEKQIQLANQLEEKIKQECPFQPFISMNSRIIQSRLSTSMIKKKDNSDLMDTQSMKLLKELEECTFSPQILRKKLDIFDRSSPIYDRQIDWRQNIKAKLKEYENQRDSELHSQQFFKKQPKYMDLRTSHALKKNIAAKYLRETILNLK